MKNISVGLERVIYTAATDDRFREALLADREGAVQRWGLELQPSERAMLRHIPAEQLMATILGVDTSPDNLRRRRFLGAVAGGAVMVAVSGCSDDAESAGIRPGDGGDTIAPTGIRPDMWPDGPDAGPDATPADAAPVDAADAAPADTNVSSDMASDMASFGMRPGG